MRWGGLESADVLASDVAISQRGRRSALPAAARTPREKEKFTYTLVLQDDVLRRQPASSLTSTRWLHDLDSEPAPHFCAGLSLPRAALAAKPGRRILVR
jgi:hypothetical protein